MLREDVGEPRRGAEHERDQRDEVRILPQQREQPAAAMQPGEETVEGDDSAASGLSDARKWSSSTGHQFGKLAARELAA